MKVYLGRDRYADWHPGMTEDDPVTVTTPDGVEQHTWGSLVAHSHGQILAQLPQEHTAATREVDMTDSDADAEDSWMVAFVPPLDVARTLAEEGGEPPEQLHITLLYLGKTGPDLTPDQAEKLPALIELWAKTQPIFHARIQGAGTFVNPGSHVLWAGVDIPGATRAHDGLIDFLTGHGLAIAHSYGWVPHITLRYDKWHVRFLPKIEPMEFEIDEVYLCHGSHWESYPLGS